MTTNSRPRVRWPLLLSWLGILASLLACTVSGTAPTPTGRPELAALRVGQQAVEGQNAKGEWVPVATESTFETTGILESTNPWQVGGTALQTRESTQIDPGLQTGDLVKVKGMILADGTWVALSIQRAQDQTGPTVVLIGKVTSKDPWVVNGITLNVTQDTLITGEIAPGTLVRVEILLNDDGTWEVLSITPISDGPDDTSGCVSVLATIESVNGNQVQFKGWPSSVTLKEDVQIGNDNSNADINANSNENTNTAGTNLGDLKAGQTVLVTLCSAGSGKIFIARITVLNPEDNVNDNANNNENSSQTGQKVLICHKPGKHGGHTLSVASAAVPAHLAHGDTMGACP